MINGHKLRTIINEDSVVHKIVSHDQQVNCNKIVYRELTSVNSYRGIYNYLAFVQIILALYILFAFSIFDHDNLQYIVLEL